MSTKLVTLLIAAGVAAGAAGCVERSQPEIRYYATATVSVSGLPDLVYVRPGVHVIANYGAPIFYANGYFWYPERGFWFRSSRYTGGWTFVARPPAAIARIDRPNAYRFYRPYGFVARNRPVPVDRIQRPVVRDHRAARRSGGTFYYRTR